MPPSTAPGSARILVLAFSPIVRDPRVQRQISLLQNEYELTVAGFGSDPSFTGELINVEPGDWRHLTWLGRAFRRLWPFALTLVRLFGLSYRLRKAVRRTRRALKGRSFDLVIANDVETLPVALEVAAGRPVILDAHEFSPRQREDNFLWRIGERPTIRWICRTSLPLVSDSITVNEELARAWSQEYEIDPEILRNSATYREMKPSNVNEGRIRLIHHGAAREGRGLELLIEMMAHLDARFTLDFMLIPGPYCRYLQARAYGDDRIAFRQPVEFDRIPESINQYDMGIYMLTPTNFNTSNALPNKFFEFIQARLGIAVSPIESMAKIVTEQNVGVVARSFAPHDMASALSELTPDRIMAFKQSAHRLAHEASFEAESQVLTDMISRNLARTDDVSSQLGDRAHCKTLAEGQPPRSESSGS